MTAAGGARVKICGITRQGDATLAVGLGAWAIGFIFHEKSPRYIDPANARLIETDRAKRCGVFVNATIERIRTTVDQAALTTIQLHGDESPDFCREVGTLGLDVIRAFRPATTADVAQMSAYSGIGCLVGLLIDAPPTAGDKARGGTGRLADWSLARAARAHGPVILSGGLNAENISNALKTVEPFAVDVSSGVEDAPGLKNHDKLKAFFANIRGAHNG